MAIRVLVSLLLGLLLVGFVLIWRRVRRFLYSFLQGLYYGDLVTEASLLETSIERLQELSSHACSAVRRAVAKNPSISPEVMLSLSGEFPAEVIQNMAFGMTFIERPDFLERVPHTFWMSARLPRSLIVFALEHPSHNIRYPVAKNKSLSFEDRVRLVQDPRHSVRIAASSGFSWLEEMKLGRSQSKEHKIASAFLYRLSGLDRFLTDPDWEVRCSAVRSLSMVQHPELWQRAGNDPHEKVREALTENPYCPKDMLEKLTQDQSQEVQLAAERAKNRTETDF